AWRHRSSWIAMAGEAGLPTAPYRQSSADDPAAHWTPQPVAPITVFAVGERAVAPPGTPQELQDGCLRLAKAAGEVLLGVDFTPGADGQLAVVDASAVPDLTRGGEPLIDALKEVLAP